MYNEDKLAEINSCSGFLPKVPKTTSCHTLSKKVVKLTGKNPEADFKLTKNSPPNRACNFHNRRLFTHFISFFKRFLLLFLNKQTNKRRYCFNPKINYSVKHSYTTFSSTRYFLKNKWLPFL